MCSRARTRTRGAPSGSARRVPLPRVLARGRQHTAMPASERGCVRAPSRERPRSWGLARERGGRGCALPRGVSAGAGGGRAGPRPSAVREPRGRPGWGGSGPCYGSGCRRGPARHRSAPLRTRGTRRVRNVPTRGCRRESGSGMATQRCPPRPRRAGSVPLPAEQQRPATPFPAVILPFARCFSARNEGNTSGREEIPAAGGYDAVGH